MAKQNVQCISFVTLFTARHHVRLFHKGDEHVGISVVASYDMVC